GMYQDWMHIVGNAPGRTARRGSVTVLADIFRVDGALRSEARAALLDEMRRAYRFALRRLRDDAGMRAHFQETFPDSLLAWDAAVGLYRASRIGARQRARWKGRVRRMMQAYGLAEPLIQEYRRAILRDAWLLRRCPQLFDGGDAV